MTADSRDGKPLIGKDGKPLTMVVGGPPPAIVDQPNRMDTAAQDAAINGPNAPKTKTITVVGSVQSDQQKAELLDPADAAPNTP